MTKPSIIAIDGPAAAGKTTVARMLARELGYLYFDTGLMYRAVTLMALRKGLKPEDESAVVGVAESVVIDVQQIDGEKQTICVTVDGEDVTDQLRTSEVDANVSMVAAYPGVRTVMTEQQRRIGQRGEVVMVGRDIGTVVLPEADLKLYVDASPEARAERRWKEIQLRGHEVSYEEILEATVKRDAYDSQRTVAPLRPAVDAIVVDTTALEPDAVLKRILALIGNS